MKSHKSPWMVLVLVSVIQILLAVVFLLGRYPHLGLFVLCAGLVYLMSYSVLIPGRRLLMASVSIILIVLLISITIPIQPLFLQIGFLYGLLLSLGSWYHLILKPQSQLIHPDQPVKFAWILVAMLPGMSLGVVTGLLVPLGSYWTGDLRISLICLSPLMAIAEEIVFRGLIQDGAADTTHPMAAVVFSALVYGIVFLSWGYLAALFACLVGLICAILYARTGSLFYSIILNSFWKIGFLLTVGTMVLG